MAISSAYYKPLFILYDILVSHKKTNKKHYIFRYNLNKILTYINYNPRVQIHPTSGFHTLRAVIRRSYLVRI
jgi:hypothetical protein